MDSYEILGVTRESSDKEIEISYEDLKRKYDPSFNTSIRAYTKYREVLKAYENIKNDLRRKMYNLQTVDEDVRIVEKKYKLFDYNSEAITKVEEINYNNLEEINQLVREDVVVHKRVSYLYYLLNLKVDLQYSRKINCKNCTSFVSCPLCDGKGVVYYKEKQMYCPKCHGKGEVSSHCDECGGKGYYKKEERISVYVDDNSMTINDYGDDYYDDSKSNLIINFDFYDKENILVKDDEIRVKYYLNKEETKNGINKEYYSETGAFKLEVPSFVSDGYSKQIIFNNKKILFDFYNEEIEGNNKEYYLFINKEYKNNTIYFNSDYSECSLVESEEYFNKVKIIDEIILDSLGEEGKYGGKNGDLMIKCIFTNKRDIEYVSGVNKIETSKFFNVLGGKLDNVVHYGFKGVNCLIKRDGQYYLLSGKSKSKIKLKNYLLFKLVSLIVWFVIPVICFLMPYSQMMYITLVSCLISYFVLINALMEVKL